MNSELDSSFNLNFQKESGSPRGQAIHQSSQFNPIYHLNHISQLIGSDTETKPKPGNSPFTRKSLDEKSAPLRQKKPFESFRSVFKSISPSNKTKFLSHSTSARTRKQKLGNLSNIISDYHFKKLDPYFKQMFMEVFNYAGRLESDVNELNKEIAR